MLRSPGRRFLVVSLLVLLMFVPLFFAAEVINSRKSYSEDTIASVGREWGGAQSISGPQLVIPVERQVTRIVTRNSVDPDTGLVRVDPETQEPLTERVQLDVTERADPIFLYPDTFTAKVNSQTQTRRRGIFQVPVYQAQIDMQFGFAAEGAGRALQDGETALWDQAELRIMVSGNRALRGDTALLADGAALQLEPLTGKSGMVARTGDPRARSSYDLRFSLNGAQSLQLAPVGRLSVIEIASDWPHPSFTGAYLPDGSEISDSGFTATWTIPHLARALPQTSRVNVDNTARKATSFGVNFIEVNDFYQKAFRAARYGVLFIALTFLTIFLIDRTSARPAHPVHYILVGLAQSVFVLLMVAYAEQIGFSWSYLLSSGATIALLTLFGATALKLGRRTAVLTTMLITVYGVLYLILQSADYALLAGSSLAFLALALTMVATRNEDWYGPERPAKKKAAPAENPSQETNPKT